MADKLPELDERPGDDENPELEDFDSESAKKEIEGLYEDEHPGDYENPELEDFDYESAKKEIQGLYDYMDEDEDEGELSDFEKPISVHFEEIRDRYRNAEFERSMRLGTDKANIILDEMLNEEPERDYISPVSAAVIADGNRYGYLHLKSSAMEISRLLCKSDLKISKGVAETKNISGVKVGIVAKPSAEFVAGLFGIWYRGGVAVPLALSYLEAELVHVINDSDIKMILCSEDHQDLMKVVVAKTSAKLSVLPLVRNLQTKSLEEDRANVVSLSLNSPEFKSVDMFDLIREIDDPALIIYSSNLKDEDKPKVYTHKIGLQEVRKLFNDCNYTRHDHVLHLLPLNHLDGLIYALLVPLYAGSTVEFLSKFCASEVWQRLRESEVIGAVTVFTGVPADYTCLIQEYDAMEQDLQTASASAALRVRLMMCGCSAPPGPVVKKWRTITGHFLKDISM